MTEPARWLVSPRFDLGLLIGPALVAAAVGIAAPAGAELPGWGYLVFVLLIDVAHVYASLWRTYLDPSMRERRPWLLTLTPLVCLLVCAALHQRSPALFWTAMAYSALYHFMRQQMGFAMLYRARAGLSPRGVDARVERWLIYAVTGLPVLWWHTQLPLQFSWFMPGDFIPGMPSWVLPPATLLTAALALTHLMFRLRSRLLTPGRDLWLLATAAVWFGGVLLSDSDLGFTISNVVAHGVPYFALVAWTAHRQHQVSAAGPGARFKGPGWLLFLLPLVALAFIEEGLWDVLVWGDNAWLFLEWDWEPVVNHPLVPLLALPQVTHYALDGFIWRTGPQNPGLKEWLLPTDPRAAS